MGTDPPNIPAKFGDDTWKPSKVIDEKLQKFDAPRNNKNTDETLQKQKDISITWGCPNKESIQKTNAGSEPAI